MRKHTSKKIARNDLQAWFHVYCRVYSCMEVPSSHPKTSTRASLPDVNKGQAKVSVAYQFWLSKM